MLIRGRIGEELVGVILWTRVRRQYEFRWPRWYWYAYGYGQDFEVSVFAVRVLWYGKRMVAREETVVVEIEHCATRRYGSVFFFNMK